ncbi:hypothetical protein F5Y15DRAFT_192409 [Xylariaceae sp. FL0016]|nr:hypothetical protein F5Y15DRAFT_192409 [Xylariaceae sp. FL0016]
MPSHLPRALAVSPLLLFTAWCWYKADLIQMAAYCEAAVAKSQIVWDGGALPIRWHFHPGSAALDDVWRGATVAFAPSAFGFDEVAWWQMFSFLVDLGPVYAVMLLESCRAGMEGTIVYLPTLFTLGAQMFMGGNVFPVYYFLHLIFASPASKLSMLPPRARAADSLVGAPLLLPLILILHTAVIFVMYCAPDLSTRHLVTWGWQMVPAWIGIANYIAFKVMLRANKQARILASPRLVLGVLGMVSAGVWVHMLASAPYDLATIFVPTTDDPTGLTSHMRRALQADHLASFGSTFLWLGYLFFDLWSAGSMGVREWASVVAALPVMTMCAGPAAALVLGWLWRERVLTSARKR